MADKLPTLEDLARAEALEDERREKMKKAYHESQDRIAKEMPDRFFTMARQVRDGVNRFNGAARLKRALTYSETAAVTTRDPNPASDFVVEIRRDPNWCVMALRQLWRLHQNDALIIECEGRVGVEPNVSRFHVRIDGRVKDGNLGWRIMSEGKEVDTPIDELPERLVAVVATGELSRMWQLAPFVEKASS